MRWMDSITDSVDVNLSKLKEIVKNRLKESDSTWQLNNT